MEESSPALEQDGLTATKAKAGLALSVVNLVLLMAEIAVPILVVLLSVGFSAFMALSVPEAQRGEIMFPILMIMGFAIMGVGALTALNSVVSVFGVLLSGASFWLGARKSAVLAGIGHGLWVAYGLMLLVMSFVAGIMGAVNS